MPGISGRVFWIVAGTLAAAFLFSPVVWAEAPAGYEYVSPVPGSRLVSPENNIILRPERRLNPQGERLPSIDVIGDQSGLHPGHLIVSDDLRTLIFEPDQPFALGERVQVEAGGESGRGLPPLQFDFFVSTVGPAQNASLAMEQSASDIPGFAEASAAARTSSVSTQVFPPIETSAQVPPGYPIFTLRSVDAPSPGLVFLSPFSNLVSLVPGNLTILDDTASPVFYRRLPAPSTDFKRQPDGRLTFFAGLSPSTPRPQFMALDSAYSVVDSFAAGNGYVTDSHDLQLLPDGHALLLAYDPEPVRMDSIVPGGDPNAIVTGLVLQELDSGHHVVFQWRSWDYFAITDLASATQSFTASAIDWVHGNAVEGDLDGNLLLSSRHLNEITKIDRRTGEILWRMGPHAKNNQFTFAGDDRGFSHQHDIRRLPNGHITLFDNGNFVLPQLSRALEFDVHELGKFARLVWEYHRVPEGYSSFMGNVQRLPDGGTMIGWGGVPSFGRLTEIHADQSVAYEIGFSASNIWTYRAYRFPWRTTRFTVEPEALDFGTVAIDSTAILTVTLHNPGPAPITLNAFEVTGGSGFFVLDPYSRTLDVGASDDLHLAFHYSSAGSLRARLAVAEVTATERIAQQVDLSGTVGEVLTDRTPSGLDEAPSAAGRAAGAPRLVLSAETDNPARGAARVRFTLPRSESATVEIFGVTGTRVATLSDGPQSAGEHVATWSADGVPGGVYFARLLAHGETIVRKFALLR